MALDLNSAQLNRQPLEQRERPFCVTQLNWNRSSFLSANIYIYIYIVQIWPQKRALKAIWAMSFRLWGLKNIVCSKNFTDLY